MKLRTKKRLLDLTSISLVLGGALTLVQALQAPVPNMETVAVKPVGAADKTHKSSDVIAVSLDPSRWNRTLRQPLYDPPPPPKKEVIVERRPITVEVVGTVIEAENSQAFVRQSNGKVEIKRLGELVTADTADGVIAAITPVEIVIRRADGEHHLSIGGRN